MTIRARILSHILAHMARGDIYAQLVAQDDQFLGRLTSDPTNPESLLNKYGPHGNAYGPLSIFNPYSQYGNKYGKYSIRNPYCDAPPKLLVNDSTLCIVTANLGIMGIDPEDFIFVLRNKRLPDLTMPG